MSTLVSQRLSFRERGVVFEEAKRVITAHSRHFFALCHLFLFPLCFSIIIYPSLFTAFSQLDGFHPLQWLLSFTADPTHLRARPILFALLFDLFALCLAACALGTIIYSTFNGHHGRPVTLSSSVKSLLGSFLPILSTLIVSQIIVCLVGIGLGVLVALLLTGLRIVGVEVNYYDNYSCNWGLVIFYVVLLVPIIVWLQINWSLACVIVVAESKWGYEPLRRSGQLVKGTRGVAASILVLYGQVFLLMVLCTSLLGKIGANRGVLFWMGTIIVVYGSSSVTELILYSLAANVVLYIYCKALHEKGALLEIAEVEGKDASLAFGGGKVSQVVNHG
ncbi:uncharacterized protein LOC116004787 [Ipomoea triloba]|uniref:uncharacterized protein LOC116004787 n=1 Tax=Ipomoea triloba TaxID=35885 RepID=UPI00125E9833|nr:uncharacterized protein LOC116004787 [Ipomoea triloba]